MTTRGFNHSLLLPATVGESVFALSSKLLHVDASDTSKITHTLGSVSSVESQEGIILNKTGSGTITTGMSTKNGRNVLEFPSADVYLESATNIALAAPFTVMVVAKSDATSALRWTMGSSPSDWFQIGWNLNSNLIEFRTGAPGTHVCSYNVTGAKTAWYIIVAQMAANGDMSLWVNNDAGSTNTQDEPWSSYTGDIRIGSGKTTAQSQEGPFADGCIWGELVTPSKIYNEVNTKWDISA